MLGTRLLRALAAAVGALAVAASPAAAFPNLIVNGDAEAGLCSRSGFEDMSNPGWTISSGAPEEVCLANTAGLPHANTPGVPPGSAFFAGGTRGDSSLTQTVSVGSDQAQIDAGAGSYHLSGWLGGAGSQTDRVLLIATFLNAGGGSLGQTQIGPVTRDDRVSVTEFLKRDAGGAIPPGTRAIKLDLNFIWAVGQLTDGYADGLSLTVNSPSLKPRPLSPPPSTVPRFAHVFLADDCKDMELCGIHAGDKWLSTTLPQIFASPAWRTQRSLLIVTWDEDGNNFPGWFGNGQTNQVATILVGSQNLVKHGFQSAMRYDHYSTARTIEQALGLAPLTDNDRYATPINDAFTH